MFFQFFKNKKRLVVNVIAKFLLMFISDGPSSKPNVTARTIQVSLKHHLWWLWPLKASPCNFYHPSDGSVARALEETLERRGHWARWNRTSRKLAVKSALYSHDEKTFFNPAWNCLKGCCLQLRKLCGGLATAFPNMASVESDFSIVKHKKSNSRKSLTNLSLGVSCMQSNLKI